MDQTEYLKCDTHLPVYFPLPQFIVDMDISSTSKLLFSVLLNRANLSQKNVWEDEVSAMKQKKHIFQREKQCLEKESTQGCACADERSKKKWRIG